eukprot:GHVU01125087.1.p1 GENE.GHVU01125087.1~~GHVU01125087.1.p1  ORF type:complete len:210 (+),score=20.24 GHVU01125087.1:1828-2457(+)
MDIYICIYMRVYAGMARHWQPGEFVDGWRDATAASPPPLHNLERRGVSVGPTPITRCPSVADGLYISVCIYVSLSLYLCRTERVCPTDSLLRLRARGWLDLVDLCDICFSLYARLPPLHQKLLTQRSRAEERVGRDPTGEGSTDSPSGSTTQLGEPKAEEQVVSVASIDEALANLSEPSRRAVEASLIKHIYHHKDALKRYFLPDSPPH